MRYRYRKYVGSHIEHTESNRNNRLTNKTYHMNVNKFSFCMQIWCTKNLLERTEFDVGQNIVYNTNGEREKDHLYVIL